jgi:hypothetical protein
LRLECVQSGSRHSESCTKAGNGMRQISKQRRERRHFMNNKRRHVHESSDKFLCQEYKPYNGYLHLLNCASKIGCARTATRKCVLQTDTTRLSNKGMLTYQSGLGRRQKQSRRLRGKQR